MWKIGTVLGICLSLIFVSQPESFAQGVKVTYSHNLSVNPFKKFLGLINLEYEYVVSNDVSVKMSVEYMIGDNLFFQKSDHPKLFADAGIRYYLQDKEVIPEGLFIGGMFGRTFYHEERTDDSFVTGLENGYRFNVGSDFYLTPKLSGYYHLKQREILPGAELRAGYSY